MFGKYFKYFNKDISFVMYDGYVAPHNIMRIIHPILMDDTVYIIILKQVNYTPFLFHVKNFMKFFKR